MCLLCLGCVGQLEELSGAYGVCDKITLAGIERRWLVMGARSGGVRVWDGQRAMYCATLVVRLNFVVTQYLAGGVLYL